MIFRTARIAIAPAPPVIFRLEMAMLVRADLVYALLPPVPLLGMVHAATGPLTWASNATANSAAMTAPAEHANGRPPVEFAVMVIKIPASRAIHREAPLWADSRCVATGLLVCIV